MTIKTLKEYHTWNGQTRIRVLEHEQPSKSEAVKALRSALGKRAMIWTDTPGRVDIGFDTRPGRQVVAFGATLTEALKGLYEWLAEFSEKREYTGAGDGVVNSLLAAGVWDGLSDSGKRAALDDIARRVEAERSGTESSGGGTEAQGGEAGEQGGGVAGQARTGQANTGSTP